MSIENAKEILTTMSTPNSTCFCCEGLLLPLIDESPYSRSGRGFLYFVGLLYSFLGVAIAAEVFMISIEKITSTKKKVKVANSVDEQNAETASIRSGVEPGYKMVNVWNPTVANLTLMALGSSAPEILLSIIEIVGNNFHSGKLGPGTIVGSAAFNLLCITGICIISPPLPETRRINAIMVFFVTATFSVFAYMWLLIILLGSSKNEVEVWEAFLTLSFFGVLVIVAFLADKKMLCFKPRGAKRKATNENGSPEEEEPLQDFAKSEKSIYDKYEREVSHQYPDATPTQLAQLVAKRIMRLRSRDRMYYRIQAGRYFEGNHPLSLDDDDILYEKPKVWENPASKGGTLSRSSSMSKVPSGGGSMSSTATVEFSARIYSFTEKRDKIKVRVVRRGRLHKRIVVQYDTVEGSAKKNDHFLQKSESLVFRPNETEKVVDLELAPEGNWEEKDGFFVHLHIVEPDERMRIGTCHPAIVRFSRKEGPPVFEFQRRNFSVKESQKVIRIPITQTGGAAMQSGTVRWRTEDVTAEDGRDYIGGSGEIFFEADEVQKFLDIPIIDDQEEEKTESFKVMLDGVGGTTVGELGNCYVSIVSDDSFKEMLTQLDTMIPHFLSKMEPGAKSWREQIVRAISLNNGDMAGATVADIVMHVLSFPFKVVFALVPPPSMMGGWLTFVVALGLIGLLTAIVGDLAGIFGCLINLKAEITAITFVALGTSLPDTFASRLAVIQDPYADNAIGNVTGSNSVNVFLGLGLPWLVASIYWKAQNKKFVVEAGALGFSVAIYSAFSVLCLGLLMVRRYVPWFGKAELGGPALPAYLCAAVCFVLWLLYVLLSALQAYCIIPFADYTC